MRLCFPVLLALCLLPWRAACVPGGLSAADKQAILDEHNRLRRRVAKGQEPGQPSATNMREMIWDDAAATVAQNYINGCPQGHNNNRNAQYTAAGGTGGVGENIAGSCCNVETLPKLIERTQAWYNEVTNPGYTYPNGFSGGTGHYTQFVWANSYKLGCGYNMCPGGWIYIVCNYNPPGNFGGQRVYESGPAGSNCPAGTTNNDGLCSIGGGGGGTTTRSPTNAATTRTPTNAATTRSPTTRSPTTRVPTSRAPTTRVPTTRSPTPPPGAPTIAPTTGTPTTAAPTFLGNPSDAPTVQGQTPAPPTASPTPPGCNLDVVPASSNGLSVTFQFDRPFAQLDCNNLKQQFATFWNTEKTHVIRMTAVWEGSIFAVFHVEDGAARWAQVSAAFARNDPSDPVFVLASRAGLPPILTVTGPAASGFPVGIVVGAVVGAIVLVALIILLVILLKRYKGSSSTYSSGARYQALTPSDDIIPSSTFTPVASVNPQQAALAAVASARRATVLWDFFPAGQPNTIAARAGEIVTLLDTSNPEWWDVRNGMGATGFIPANYLQENKRESLPTPPPTPSVVQVQVQPQPAPVQQYQQPAPVQQYQQPAPVQQYQQPVQHFQPPVQQFQLPVQQQFPQPVQQQQFHQPVKVQLPPVPQPPKARAKAKMKVKRAHLPSNLPVAPRPPTKVKVKRALPKNPNLVKVKRALPKNPNLVKVKRKVAVAPTAPAKKKALPAPPPQGRPVKAIYKYTAGSEREISMEPGEMFTLVPGSDTSGEWWFIQRRDGTKGYVPATYLK